MTTTNEVRETEWAGAVSPGVDLALTFDLHNVDDLLVTLRNDSSTVEELMKRGEHYSVTTGENGVAPVLTTIATIAASTRWRIRRISQAHQNLSLSGTVLPYGDLEDTLDRFANYYADVKGELDRCFRIPDGELSVSGGNKVDNLEDRKGKYLYYDVTTGALTVSVGVATTTISPFTDNGKDLVGATYTGMRTQLNVRSNAYTAVGDIATASSVSAETVIAAPANSGRVLMTNPANQPEVGDVTALAPTWQTPWVHPFIDKQGFRIRQIAGSETTKLGVSRGACHPEFREGAVGGRNDYSTDGRELRIDKDFVSSWDKLTKVDFAIGDGGGGKRSGMVTPDTEILYVFVIGRSNDDTFDIIIDDSIDGSGAAADVVVAAWHSTNKLMMERIGSIVVDGSADMIQHHQRGDWYYAKRGILLMDDVDVGLGANAASVDFATFTPAEPCSIKLRILWEPVSVGDKFTIRSGYTDAGSGWQTNDFIGIAAVATAAQTFEVELAMDENQSLNVETFTDVPISTHLSKFSIWQIAYEDRRGQVF